MTITRIMEIIHRWTGWCPEAGTIRTAPVLRSYPSADMNTVQPDGRPAGSGRIGRGVTFAIGSIRILLRNRRLFWFSILIGILTIVNLASILYLQFISGTSPFPGTNILSGPAPVLIARGSPLWVALTFITTLVTTFLMYYVLAALIASVSHILSGRTATTREALAHAGKFLRSLGTWALIGAFLGTGLTLANSSAITDGSTGNLGIMVLAVLVNVVFFALTIFVVPLLVLGNEGLINAFLKSFSLFRMLWVEILACLFILFLIAFAVVFIFLVPTSAIAFSTGSTAAVGAAIAAYMLGILIVISIGSTILEIAIVGLYSYGQTGTLSTAYEGKQSGVQVP